MTEGQTERKIISQKEDRQSYVKKRQSRHVKDGGHIKENENGEEEVFSV